MSAQDAATPPGDPGSLEELSRMALDLAARLPGPLRGLRVRSGKVSVEVEWPHGEAPAHQPSTATAAATTGGEAAAGPEQATGSEGDDLFYVCSPMVGTFYHAPEPGAAPFVSVGDTVDADQQVGIIEAMKLMNRLDAGREGRVVAFLVPDGTAVEYGERLVACAPPDGEA